MSKKTTSKLFPSEEVKEKETQTVDVDIDISAIRKKRVRINGDDSKIIELNISDLNIVNRLEVAHKQLNELMDEVYSKVKEPEDPDNLSDGDKENVMEALAEIDSKMRDKIDYIFDSPVSDACSDGGSMWDPLDGAFRYEHIIESLLGLYERNLTSEYAKLRNNVDRKVQDHKRKAVSKYHK